MASTDWLSTKDAELDDFASDMSAKISAAPTVYGFTTGEAATLATTSGSFTTALGAATDPATRTKGTVAAKDTAKAVLIALVRSMARRIQANPAITAAQKADLGLPIHSAVPTPVPPPATKPLVNVLDVDNLAHVIRLADEATPARRARPAGAAGAEVYSFVGDDPPADLEMWRFEGIATKSDFRVDYNGADAGKDATIVARWFNRKGEPGPVSDPVVKMIAA